LTIGSPARGGPAGGRTLAREFPATALFRRARNVEPKPVARIGGGSGDGGAYTSTTTTGRSLLQLDPTITMALTVDRSGTEE
jgi:hypothetical protein